MLVRVLLCLFAGLSFGLLTGCHTFSNHFGAIPPPPLLGHIDDPEAYTGVPPAAVGSNESGKKSRSSKNKSPEWDFSSYCLAKAKQIEGESDENKRQLMRNDAVGFLTMKIRQSQDVYTARVSMHRSGFETGSDLTLAAATAFSAINPSTAIGATSTALVAGKASIEKNFYDDVSRTALLIDMYKSEQSSFSKLDTHRSNSYKDYPMLSACNDLDDYLRSASVIRSVQVTAADVVPVSRPTTPTP